MKTFLPFMLLIVLILSSCSRNQRKVNRIDGKWNVVSAEIQGYGEADPDIIYEFEFCRLRTDEFCDFSVHNFETNDMQTGVYTIENSGNTLAMTISDGFGFQYREYTIVRATPWRLVLETNNAPVGEFSRMVLRKVR